ncbi:glycoside hydrolase family protein [Draconibacterium sediminis]|nr:glycoside hydrolase family protein [Draconibacterium sediminis]
MMKKFSLNTSALLLVLLFSIQINAQVTERQKPEEWNRLVKGGRFLDRFMPISPLGKLTTETWGAEGVIPRYTDNGIEDPDWSYWGGNILKGDDGKFHLFVCRWPENSPKGHMEWPKSEVVHAVADNTMGPFKVQSVIGKGHNPEAYRMKDGRYIIYVIDGYYLAESIDGPWKAGKFEFNPRDREIIEGLSNLSFVQREDGSFVMVCRGGGIWLSKDGLSPWQQVTSKRVYPDVDGRFEDPVIWRDNVQYNLIVNDWLGRIAFYLRSKDGVHWKVDPGEAYIPGITVYTDGTNEDWFKYERIKIFQDEYRRAVQANFAVIDTIKWDDKTNDRHSSKNIGIPLNKGVLMTILDEEKIDDNTKTIRVKIEAEPSFNPLTDIDVNSLHFGAPEVVNFGGGCTVSGTEPDGNDLIVTFKGSNNGFRDDSFAAKLLGKDKNGKLLLGYARLPWVEYIEPILSARLPVLNANGNLEVEVENFGQIASKNASLKIELVNEQETIEIASAKIPGLNPFEKTKISMKCSKIPSEDAQLKVSITYNRKMMESLTGTLRID